jgi:hypothetical protein
MSKRAGGVGCTAGCASMRSCAGLALPLDAERAALPIVQRNALAVRRAACPCRQQEPRDRLKARPLLAARLSPASSPARTSSSAFWPSFVKARILSIEDLSPGPIRSWKVATSLSSSESGMGQHRHDESGQRQAQRTSNDELRLHCPASFLHDGEDLGVGALVVGHLKRLKNSYAGIGEPAPASGQINSGYRRCAERS